MSHDSMKKPDVEQFFQDCAHAIIGVDAVGNILSINRKARKLLGHNDSVFEGNPIEKILPITGKLILDAMATQEPCFGRQACPAIS